MYLTLVGANTFHCILKSKAWIIFGIFHGELNLFDKSAVAMLSTDQCETSSDRAPAYRNARARPDIVSPKFAAVMRYCMHLIQPTRHSVLIHYL